MLMKKYDCRDYYSQGKPRQICSVVIKGRDEKFAVIENVEDETSLGWKVQQYVPYV